jgi:NAD(P)-dependent dehydrogenase (short-subunit alcohol dehydrogenase family)
MSKASTTTAIQGKTIVLTGGSSGIGFELAMQLAAKGNTVYSFDRRPFPLQQEGVHAIVVDITNDQDVRQGMEQIPGPIHVLFNNAGMMRRGTIFDAPEEDFDTLFGVHVKGSWLMLRRARPKLANDAMIVQMSSVHALHRSVNPGLYTLAKQAVAEMARNIAQQEPQYTVKILFPGPVDTPLARFDVTGKALEEKKKIMETAESVAAKIIRFLESEGAELHYDSETQEYTVRG